MPGIYAFSGSSSAVYLDIKYLEVKITAGSERTWSVRERNDPASRRVQKAASRTRRSRFCGDCIDELIAEWGRERPDLDPWPLEILGRIQRLSTHLSRIAEQRLQAIGLTWETFSLIVTLRRAGPPYALRPTDIYRKSLLTSGTITNRIDNVVRWAWRCENLRIKTGAASRSNSPRKASRWRIGPLRCICRRWRAALIGSERIGTKADRAAAVYAVASRSSNEPLPASDRSEGRAA